MSHKPTDDVSQRLLKLESTLSELSENVAMLAQDVGRAFTLLATSYEKLESAYNQNVQDVQSIKFSQATYLGDHRALTYLKSGHKMFVDTRSVDIGTHLMLGGEWETHYTDAFLRQIKPNDTVIDIGANHGFYTLLSASMVGPRGRVYAFEASRKFCELINATVSINGLSDRVILEHSAVADRAFDTEMLFDAYWSGAGHLIGETDQARLEQSQRHWDRERVNCIALDDYFSGSESPVDLIKMDIEGAEGLALKGMLGLLDRSPGLTVMMEFCPNMISRFDVQMGEIIEILKTRQFRTWTIQTDSSLVPVTWEQLLERPAAVQNIMLSRQALK